MLEIKDKGTKVQEISGVASKELFSGFTNENVERPKLNEWNKENKNWNTYR